MRRSEPVDGVALDRAADPGERDRRADGFAHDQFLDVTLGEFVGIMTRDPARSWVGQGQHRELDQSGALDQPVEQAQFEGVDKILGVVKHHRLGARGTSGFVIGEREIETRYYVANAPSPGYLNRTDDGIRGHG